MLGAWLVYRAEVAQESADYLAAVAGGPRDPTGAAAMRPQEATRAADPARAAVLEAEAAADAAAVEAAVLALEERQEARFAREARERDAVGRGRCYLRILLIRIRVASGGEVVECAEPWSATVRQAVGLDESFAMHVFSSE